MTRVGIYARVSMEEDQQGNKRYQDLENQLIPLRDWAKGMGWEIVQEYIDRGSGADPARIQFRQLQDDAMQRKFSIILVWKIDRFSRESMSVVVGRIQTLRTRGVAIKSYTESWFDTSEDNPMSELILAVMAWAAAEERRKISERTKAGIQRRRNIGQWKGGRPKGSKNKKGRKVYLTIEQQAKLDKEKGGTATAPLSKA